ncbi:MFS transporter [Brachybacterium sp. J144]|uniref:MFS transporter n=1 Tax=Brachybacterium sp. J144 TaxID=3116487 RepID=UPI002E785F68|nr:MFS transporter [Brachybacterium sp. J144]MEE1651029.1 MFS transporter [Brachybacterium sp. J144]
MATFVDAAATTGIGIALVLFQAVEGSTDGLTGNQIGLLTSVLTLGVAIGSLAGGRLGDRYGRRKVFVVTLAIIVLGSVAPFISLGFASMALGIGLIGLGVGADLPVAMATISEWAENHNRGKILVFSNILGGFGIAMAVGLSIAYGSLGPVGGKIIFGAFGFVGLITLLLRLTIPESPSWLAARAERDAGVRTIRADHVSLKDLVKAPYGSRSSRSSSTTPWPPWPCRSPPASAPMWPSTTPA